MVKLLILLNNMVSFKFPYLFFFFFVSFFRLFFFVQTFCAGAILFGLEHRFYGESSPFDSLNSTTLPYLTTQQAYVILFLLPFFLSFSFLLFLTIVKMYRLSDIVNFRAAMIQQYNISQVHLILYTTKINKKSVTI